MFYREPLSLILTTGDIVLCQSGATVALGLRDKFNLQGRCGHAHALLQARSSHSGLCRTTRPLLVTTSDDCLDVLCSVGKQDGV